MKVNEHTVVVPFDLTAGQDDNFCLRIEELVTQGLQSIGLDCSRLDPVCSSHIGLLWKAKDICYQKSVEISLENVNYVLTRTLQVLDLAEVVEIKEANKPQPVVTRSVKCPCQGRKQHSGDFQADTAGINLGLREFMVLIDEWQLDEETKFDLRTLFYEVVNNIQCHSGLPPDATIRYQAIYADGELRLVFEDNGKPFNPLLVPDDFDPETAARNHQTRGFGINLIRRLTDSIEYTRRDNITNVLTLIKFHGEG